MRRPNHDYSQPGAYFVTICVQERRDAFGEVRTGEMLLSAAGKQVEAILLSLEERFPTILVDCFVIMPNHVHAVIVLGAREPVVGERGAMNRAATGELGAGRLAESKLGEVIRVFKAVSTRAIGAEGDAAFAWRSDYHDRIVRTDRELAAIQEYVAFNPLRWDADTFNDSIAAIPSPSRPAARG